MHRRKITAAVLLTILVAAVALVYHVHERLVPSPPAAPSPVVVGSFHVHSDLSHDSRLTLTELAAAARTAKVDFIVLADHNNQYAGPLVRDGIVFLSYAELSTGSGHLLQMGATRVLDRALRDGPRIFQAVHDLGGSSVIPHPTDPKRPWTGPWDGAAGLEIANFASAARRHGGPGLLGLAPLLAAGLVNRHLALAQVYDRDGGALALWDSHPDPSLIAFCGVDAHGWIDVADNLRAWTLVMAGPWPDTEAERPAWVAERLTTGQFYCSAGLLGPPPGLVFALRPAGREVPGPSDTTSVTTAKELYAHVDTPVTGDRLVLFRNGLAVANAEGAQLHYPSPALGTYRVELWRRVPDLLYGEHVVPVAYSERVQLTPAATFKLPVELPR